MGTNQEHRLRANKDSSRLSLLVARFNTSLVLSAGLKPEATNSEPLWGSSNNAKLMYCPFFYHLIL